MTRYHGFISGTALKVAIVQQVGLTGGIASGKSLVSGMFEELGIPVIDADVVAREVVKPGTAGLQALVEHFGGGILTAEGELDRAELRGIVFSDPKERRFLDATLHPLIRRRSEELAANLARQAHACVIHAIPLLVETGQQARFSRIIVVDVPASMQLARLLARDGSSIEQAQAILDSQASRAERLAVADDVIDNSGSILQTRAQVEAVHQRLQQQRPTAPG